jgi:hypothetical protein
MGRGLHADPRRVWCVVCTLLSNSLTSQVHSAWCGCFLVPFSLSLSIRFLLPPLQSTLLLVPSRLGESPPEVGESTINLTWRALLIEPAPCAYTSLCVFLCPFFFSCAWSVCMPREGKMQSFSFVHLTHPPTFPLLPFSFPSTAKSSFYTSLVSPLVGKKNVDF